MSSDVSFLLMNLHPIILQLKTFEFACLDFWAIPTLPDTIYAQMFDTTNLHL